jgi:hypothetical protein
VINVVKGAALVALQGYRCTYDCVDVFLPSTVHQTIEFIKEKSGKFSYINNVKDSFYSISLCWRNPMMLSKKTLFALFVAALMISKISAAPDPNFHIYILFGQSNMTGGGATSPTIAEDCNTSPRIKVMAYMDCSGNSPECNKALGRTHDKWYTASPPLHDCSEGLCPGDYFAKTMLDSINTDISIGLVPCALAGVALNVFTSTGPNSTIGPCSGSNAYKWMLARCKLAQESGVIKGILLHQGESGSGGTAWLPMAKGIFDALKKDLSLDANTPVVAGELRSDNTSPSQNNTNFNKMVDSLPSVYAHSAVASSSGLTGNGKDVWHFTTAGFRELGKRYANALLSVSSSDFIPRKGSVKTINTQLTNYPDLKLAATNVSVYSLNGRMVRSFSGTDGISTFQRQNTNGVYIVSYKLKNGRSTIIPFVKE